MEQQKRKLITELEDSRELLEEKRTKLEELNGQLMKREEELSQVLTRWVGFDRSLICVTCPNIGSVVVAFDKVVWYRSDEEAANVALLQKQIRDMQTTIDELREDIETERTARNKAEMARR